MKMKIKSILFLAAKSARIGMLTVRVLNSRPKFQLTRAFVIPVILTALILCLSVGKAAAEPLLFGAAHQGMSEFASSTLYLIDPLTGAATQVGTGIGFSAVSAMAFVGQTLFGVGRRTLDQTDVLISINQNTGVGTEVAQISGGSQVHDMSVRNADGSLYVLSAGASHDCRGIGSLNVTTGVITPVGGGNTCAPGNGLAFSQTDVLYHANHETGGTLHIFNQATGVASPETLLTYDDFPGGDFDNVKGTHQTGL